MDMDDDFMGEVEFDLNLDQREVVSRAIELASRQTDEFQMVNPLISIMQWWQSRARPGERRGGSPEETLVQACRSYVAAHDNTRR